MSAKNRHKQLPITMFLTTPTPTPTGSRRDGTAPMTRKRKRELEAEAAKGSADVDSADVETPPRAGKRPKRSSKPTPKPTPGGKGKARLQQGDADLGEGRKRAGPSKAPHRAVRSARKAGNLLTPESEGILGGAPVEDSAVSSLKTPLAELKLRTSTESPLPRITRKDLRSNVGLPTPIPSSRNTSKSKTNQGALAKPALESPDSEPVSLSSSPLSPLTDLPDLPSSPRRPPAQDSSPIFKIPALPLNTPHRTRAENWLSDSGLLRRPATAIDPDEIVPTSQSQDLRPFIVSPARPGGSTLLKDTTPKALRRSQGYNSQPPQPLPSVLATIQARGHRDAETQESDVVPTSQMEETELRIPRSARNGSPRAPVLSTPSDKGDKSVPSQREPPSSGRNGILRTPTKISNFPLDGKVHIMR